MQDPVFPMSFVPGDGRLLSVDGSSGTVRYCGPAGHFIYGPYLPLEPGEYQVDFVGQLHSFGERGIEFDVVYKNPRVDNGLMDLARQIGGEIRAGTIASLPFTVSEQASSVEFRVLPSTDADVSISSVYLNKVTRYRRKTTAPLWVLVTGMVRDAEAVRSRFRFLGDLKRRGVIDQVVFSTWVGEAFKDAEVTAIIKENGFQVVESQQPELVSLGHFIHQIVTLDNGLRACPDDAFIFKSRTDKTGPKEGFHEGAVADFLSSRTFAHRCTSRINPQRYKIGIFGPSAYHSTIGPSICLWHDQTYFGFKKDLQRLVNYNIYAFDVHHMAPEQALFGHPIVSRYTAVDRLFRSSDSYEVLLKVTWNLSGSTAAKLNNFAVVASQNKMVRHALILERVYLSECFFNLHTNQEFCLDLSYRGLDLSSFEDSANCVETFRSGLDTAFDYEEDERSFRESLVENFGIHYRLEPQRLDRDGLPVMVFPESRYKARINGAYEEFA